MNLGPPLKEQFRRTRFVWVRLWAAAWTVLVLVWFLGREGSTWRSLTRDPIVELHGSITTGLLSNVGMLFWAGGAAVCFFAASELRRRGGASGSARFMFWSGVFTTWMMCDDLFLFHDRVFPGRLGISENWCDIGYLLLCSTWLVVFRRRILEGNWAPLFVALSLFAGSMGHDAFICDTYPASFLIEDGLKFLGIATWTTYFWGEASRLLGGETAAFRSSSAV